ncbi:NADH-ubiquinone oxidoreductase chain E [alpha proteobacterium U9-1i]|nr:NADH-ubiquinone oxidoreductase chain E [alpha proteobacterium U9-1i]
MIYLITQLAGFLLLASASAALMGWVYAAVQAMPARARQRSEREALVRDLRALATAEGGAPAPLADPELASLRSRVALEGARAAEAERNLEAARARADDAVSRIAELERALEQQSPAPEIMPSDAIEVEAIPVLATDSALQAWRLRYFEQRVRYLEATLAPAAPPALEVADPAPLEWRARVAEARASHLEEEVRNAERGARNEPAPIDPEPQEVSAFAADVETDALLRWRMLYLERRVAHLQAEAAAAPPPAPVSAPTGPDPELWKWRSRYLEARLRHLESREPLMPPQTAPAVAVAPQVVAADPDEPPERVTRLVPAGAEERPPTLPGPRGGAPDDLTLIDGVSQLQQTTFYSLGVFHFDQIASWSPANVAWVDQYLRLRGRIVDEEWVEQAEDLSRDGVVAARRVLEGEDA